MDYQLKLRINSADVTDYRHLIQFSDMHMYYHTQNGYQLFSSGVMVIPFCLETTMLTGGYLYGVGYNILEIRDGTSSILYQD